MMITPAEQIIRLTSENYDRGLRDGARAVLGALEDLGVISTSIAAAMQGETDRILRTTKSSVDCSV